MYWLVTPLIAALWDWKTGDIPDWLTVPGIIVAILYAFFVNPGLLPALFLFAGVGYLFYRFGVVGGGDVLLILAILPFLHMYSPVNAIILPFLLLFLGITVTSALYGFYLHLKDGRWWVLLPLAILPIGVSVLYGVILFGLLKKDRFIREVSVDELQEEDVLAEDIPGFSKRVIEHGDKEFLKKKGVERVKILVNLPKMGPGLFLSLLPLLYPGEALEVFLLIPVLGLFRGS